jgi:hypothetical protein
MRLGRRAVRLQPQSAIAPPAARDPSIGLAWNPDRRALLVNVWSEHRWLVAISGLHLMVLVTLGAAGMTTFSRAQVWEWGVLLHLVFVAFLMLPCLLLGDLIRLRSIAQVQRRYLTARSVTGMLAGCSFVALESQIHRALKQMIGQSNPFRWDRALSHADEWLHFGVAPWRWLDRIFHPALLTSTLDMAYWLWFPLIIAAGCGISWMPERRTRARVLIAWGMTWILLGTGLAQTLSSAGPAFFHFVAGPPDPYGALLAHLDTVNHDLPLLALTLQQALWNSRGVGGGAWNGISAMPSMHVAIPALIAIALFRPYRAVSIVMWAYVLLIWCGSVYLGWHYALDGYVSLIAVAILWRLSDRLLATPSLRDLA